MELKEDFELPESLFVELDPLVATGVLLEVHPPRRPVRSAGEMVPTTDNQLLRFSSRDKQLVYAALAEELGSRANDAEGQTDG